MALYKMVRGERVEMTAEEIQKHEADQAQGTEPVELDPVYRDLSDVEFMGLVRKAGPLTPAQFVEIMQTSTVDAVVMLRIMLSMNKAGIARDAELVGEGLQILTTVEYLNEEGVDRIMGAWPVE